MASVHLVERLKDKLIFRRHTMGATLPSLCRSLLIIHTSELWRANESPVSILHLPLCYGSWWWHITWSPSPVNMCCEEFDGTREVECAVRIGKRIWYDASWSVRHLLTRMPFGMVEYMAAFFNSTPGINVINPCLIAYTPLCCRCFVPRSMKIGSKQCMWFWYKVFQDILWAHVVLWCD